MLVLWIYLALSLLVAIRISFVIRRDNGVGIVGWKRVLRVVILDTIRWPYYILRYGLESFIRDLR